MMDAAAIAIMVLAMASCVVGTNYIQAEKEKAMTPQQMCVKNAWSQKDRIECLNQHTAAKDDAK